MVPPSRRDRPRMDGHRPERQVVSALRDRADVVIDTSLLTPPDLKRLLTGRFALDVFGLRVFVTPLPAVAAADAIPA